MNTKTYLAIGVNDENGGLHTWSERFEVPDTAPIGSRRNLALEALKMGFLNENCPVIEPVQVLIVRDDCVCDSFDNV